jgi:hypothetical protein
LKKQMVPQQQQERYSLAGVRGMFVKNSCIHWGKKRQRPSTNNDAFLGSAIFATPYEIKFCGALA